MAHPESYKTQVSVPLPPEAAIKNVIGDGYNPETTLNVIKMMAGTEDMYGACAGFIRELFRTEGVSPRIREMIMLRVAKVLNSPYEWQANTVLAKNIGLTASEIEAASSEGPVLGIAPEYVFICQVTDELSLSATLSDLNLTGLLERYGEVVTRKLILIISWFNLLSRFLNGCRVPLESTDKIGQGTTPLQ